MRKIILVAWISAIWLALLAPVTMAQVQQGTPRIGYVYPAGGRQGTTFEATIGGQFLDGVDAAHASGEGAAITVIEYVKPINQREAGVLRDQLKELMTRRAATRGERWRRPATLPTTQPAWTKADDDEVAAILAKLARFRPRDASPAIGETVKLKVTLTSTARPGVRSIRLVTANGLTNPLVFEIGEYAEVVDDERNGSAAPAETTVRLPTVLNGQIMPGDVDRYRFKAEKGQKIVAAVSARKLIPFIADAVPGWFQPTLAIMDATGKEVAYADDFRFNPDPLLCWTAPASGEYVAEIKDSIYRGREDFVYRLLLGEVPYATGVFPLGAQSGSSTQVALSGWNLPVAQLIVDGKGAAGVAPVALPPHVAGEALFALDGQPHAAEKEPNNEQSLAQPIEAQLVVDGRIDQPGDVDAFRMERRTGEEIVAEVYARRQGSPLDAMLRITDATGKQLAANDDHEDKGSGLNTHHADSLLRYRVPAPGTYYLWLGDTQGKGGDAYAYRLRVSEPQPDFELRVTPSSLWARGGSSIPFTVHALRRDGFSGEIAISLKDAPEGFSLSGAAIPANQDSARLTLLAPAQQIDQPIALQIEGKARIRGRDVLHPAQPADDVMQAFAYRHLLLTDRLLVTVAGRFIPRGQPQIVTKTPVRIRMGQICRVEVTASAPAMLGELQFELDNPPEGISLASVKSTTTGKELQIKCESVKGKRVTAGNLIVNIYMTPQRAAEGAPMRARRRLIGTLPAIPFTIG